MPAIRISIHAPLVGGDDLVIDIFQHIQISIHAPLVGGDGTPMTAVAGIGISIHAPLVGGDGAEFTVEACNNYFNPRPPRRGRPAGNPFGFIITLFQSTPPS